MKQILCVFLTGILLLAGCANKKTPDNAYGGFYKEAPDNLDYTASGEARNLFLTANFTEGLMEYDEEGKLVGAIASSAESNEDKTVWTFQLRKDIQWVTADGEEYAEVTAEDFVTGLQHALDKKSEDAKILAKRIVGAESYMNGTGSFAAVGIEAADPYTLIYRLTAPCDFPALTVHGVLYPINRSFFESKSCSLGNGDSPVCRFGETGKDNILYNGPYLLSEYSEKGTIRLVKNENYRDRRKVYPKEVTFYYDDGTDPHFAMKKFEDGEISYAPIESFWFKDDYDSYMSKYEGYVRTAAPDDSLRFVLYNPDRVYGEGSERSAEEIENTRKALADKNFRLAILTAFDRSLYLTPECADKTLGNMSLRNTISEGGAEYRTILEAKLKGSFLSGKDLADGADAFFDPAASKSFLALAGESGITFPVILELGFPADDPGMMHRASIFKNSVETSTNGQILIRLSEGADKTQSDLTLTDVLTPLTLDPASYLEELMTHLAGEENESVRVFNDFMRAAESTKDAEAKTGKYAEAEAWVLSEGLIIPIGASSAVRTATRVKNADTPRTSRGMCAYRLKYLYVSDTLVKSE